MFEAYAQQVNDSANMDCMGHWTVLGVWVKWGPLEVGALSANFVHLHIEPILIKTLLKVVVVKMVNE